MNKTLFVYILFLVPILCTSCDWFGEPEKQDIVNVTKIEGISPALKLRLNEQDSLYSELALKIDSLTAGLNQSKGYIEDLQSEIKELKSPSRVLACLALFALLLSIIAIVMSIIKTNKKVGKFEVKDITKQMVREQVKDLEYRMKRAETNIKEMNKVLTTSQTDSVDSLVDKRLMDLELRMSRIATTGPVSVSNQSSFVNQKATKNIPTKRYEMVNIGYAKVNSNKYFVEIFNSKQEDCVYIIKFINEEEGEFDIISLDKIKSINDIKYVVDLTSDSCQLTEATFYQVIGKGRCRREDEKIWEVTKKLVIKVFK